MIKSTLMVALILLAVSCKKAQFNSNDHSASLDPIQNSSNNGMENDHANSDKQYTADQMTSVSFNEENFDFGKINKKKGKVHHYYQFTNTGDKPLMINVVPGCGCTVGNYTKDPIPPGATDSIKLEFNPSAFSGEIHKSATVSGNFPDDVKLRFTADVQE